ncbi:MAG: hypothetical protein JNL02_11110 [Saprospiraceae bacterium]|nr:hypothetical protein [Saprospiraceae bacterium]
MMIPREEAIKRICDFLTQIGIPFQKAPIEGRSFLPGLKIDQGSLTIDVDKLEYPGDILHEAGHIALFDPLKRPFLNQEMLDTQPSEQSEEIGVQLWSYFAAEACGVPAEMVFHDGGYHTQNKWIIDNFRKRIFVGMPLLVWMRIADPVPKGEYPVIRNWLRQ